MISKKEEEMNIPTLETERLILRKFNEHDLEALYKILSDKEVNRFLPWFPLKTLEETRLFYEKQFVDKYKHNYAYYYAICMKNDNYPIGYIHVCTDDSHDFGYGLHKAFWHQGIVTEAGIAVIEQLKKDGIPYITATHDVNNPKSGEVMKRLGMKYQYSYEEQWQPKDMFVTFRMYQLNLDETINMIYKEYWNHTTNHFIETDI